MQLHFQFVTPEKTVYDQQVDSITCSTTLGQVTILPHHVPFVGELVPDELVVRVNGEEQILHCGGGFVQVLPSSRIVILADTAEKLSDIDIQRAEEAARRAKELLEKTQLSDREYATTSALLDRNLARLKVVRKHAHRRSAPITGEGVLEE